MCTAIVNSVQCFAEKFTNDTFILQKYSCQQRTNYRVFFVCGDTNQQKYNRTVFLYWCTAFNNMAHNEEVSFHSCCSPWYLVVYSCKLYSNSLRPRQNGRHFADDICKCIFLNENVWIPIKISLKFVPKGPINNIPALVQIMAWRRPGDKPLSEPMMVSLPTHIGVDRPQWDNPRKFQFVSQFGDAIKHGLMRNWNMEFCCRYSYSHSNLVSKSASFFSMFTDEGNILSA